MTLTNIALLMHFLLIPMVLARVLLRPHREPASRIAWVVVVATLPALGILFYLLFGEVNIGRREIARMREVMKLIPPAADFSTAAVAIPEQYQPLFKVGQSISGYGPTSGNTAALQLDSNATIDAMVADIDAAVAHVHVLFYIWLADNNGCKIVAALQRAAARGVKCRAMADGLGSRAMIRSRHWREMRTAGVQLGIALSPRNLLLRPFRGRIDLRNHRKIVVIDGRITYCGSQNCADPEFRVKPKYAPWVDAVIRFEGPVARQNQHLFVGDWMSCVDEDLGELLSEPVVVPPAPGITAAVVATGPTLRSSAMPEMFESLMHAARRELVISTPYYVPNESMQDALCATAYRGVATTLIVPQRNDSWVVAAASRSYYAGLLEAGVRIFEYQGGVLHAKSLTLDGNLTLIGSANMDRRSFDLNYENNILFCDARLTAAVYDRQQEYVDKSVAVTFEQVAAWPVRRRLWNNTVAMLGPVL